MALEIEGSSPFTHPIAPLIEGVWRLHLRERRYEVYTIAALFT